MAKRKKKRLVTSRSKRKRLVTSRSDAAKKGWATRREKARRKELEAIFRGERRAQGYVKLPIGTPYVANPREQLRTSLERAQSILEAGGIHSRISTHEYADGSVDAELRVLLEPDGPSGTFVISELSNNLEIPIGTQIQSGMRFEGDGLGWNDETREKYREYKGQVDHVTYWYGAGDRDPATYKQKVLKQFVAAYAMGEAFQEKWGAEPTEVVTRLHYAATGEARRKRLGRKPK